MFGLPTTWLKRAHWLPVCLLWISSPASANVVIPSDEVMRYCAGSGCDNQVFYRYYDKNAQRFCSERKSMQNHPRQSRVFRFVYDRIVESGLPVTATIVPILESSLDPAAKASRHPNSAKGLWQLKPDTARDMGLIVDDTTDQRMDVRLSTQGGIRYLSWLTEKFDGDHNLAVLAYHTGIGRVSRMSEKYRTKNPWFLSQLISDGKADQDYLLKYYAYALALMNKGCGGENA